jgi:CRP-like cAMP-binding protein
LNAELVIKNSFPSAAQIMGWDAGAFDHLIKAIRASNDASMEAAFQILADKLTAHSALNREDLRLLYSLSGAARVLEPNEDIVRQGDEPKASVVVLSGMLARYHTLRSGKRQYLSFHIPGDMPDAQAIFIDKMDHALCAIDRARIALIPHKQLLSVFDRRPAIAYAIWRETLIDASIFREAITNNSSRAAKTRLAHFYCEQYYLANARGFTKAGAASLPLSQTQLGEALGMSLATVSRTVMAVRRTNYADHRDNILQMRNWKKLAEVTEFDPAYLHLSKQSKSQ